MRTMATFGVERALAGVHPTAHWRSNVLHLGYPTDRELHLCGRGLLLMPSFFCLGLLPVVLGLTGRLAPLF